jgi:hypothetical protein
MKKLISLLLACVLVFALASCADIKGKIEDTLGGAVAGGSSSEDAKIDKHNAYIDLYNVLIDDIDRVVDDYVEEFGYEDAIYIEDGFSGFTVYSNSIAAKLEAAYAYADKKPAEPDADAALKALYPTLLEYADALTDAKRYYGDKNYVDDDFAKAQTYHDVIIGKYDALWEPVGTFLTAVNIMLEGQDDEQLAAYLESGSMVRYYCLLTLIKAQEADSYLSANDITVENILDVNIDEFRPIYDEFAAAFAEFDALLAENKDAPKDEGIMSFTWFDRDLRDVKSSLSQLVQKVQNGEAFSASDVNTASLKDGTPENISKSVASLLNSYNSWIV